MRIMLVNTYYSPEIIGGAEYSVKKLAEQLQHENNEVVVLCTGDNFKDEYIDGIFVRRIRVKNICRAKSADRVCPAKKILRRMQDIWNPLNTAIIEKIISEEKPEVIHTNGLYDISPIIWKIAKQRGIRVVHTLRDYYLMCPRVSLTCSHVSGTCQKPTFLCKLYRSVNRNSSKYVDVVTAPSAIVLDTLKDNGYFKKSLGKVVPNATEFDEESVLEICQERQAVSHSAPQFVFLGSLIQVKGIQWLIESFRRLENPDVKLYIAGKGELEEYVKSAAKQDKRIRFVGFLDEKEVSELLEKTDVLIAPSLWEEPFGRIVLDAYKHAMPVIVSDCGALPTLVDEGKTGLVVNSKELNSLENAMHYFIQNPEKIAEFSKYSAEKIKKFSLEAQYQMFWEVYQQ